MSEAAAHQTERTGALPPARGMRRVPGGAFRMGAEQSYLEEAPVHTVNVSGFWMDEVQRWA